MSVCRDASSSLGYSTLKEYQLRVLLATWPLFLLSLQLVITQCTLLRKSVSKSPRLTSNVSATTLTSHTFRDLMEKGKVKNALRYLSSDHTGGILRMEDSVPVTNKNGDVIECSVQDVLVEKHPNGKSASPSALLSFTQSHVNPILFD